MILLLGTCHLRENRKSWSTRRVGDKGNGCSTRRGEARRSEARRDETAAEGEDPGEGRVGVGAELGKDTK